MGANLRIAGLLTSKGWNACSCENMLLQRPRVKLIKAGVAFDYLGHQNHEAQRGSLHQLCGCWRFFESHALLGTGRAIFGSLQALIGA